MEKRRKEIGDGFTEICKREMGLSQPRTFARRFSSLEVLVAQINIYRKLNGHQGCVNAVEFNSAGDLLVSGSDDRQVKIWDWEAKTIVLSYSSGHFDNLFQARVMPFSDDRRIITSSADGQVRLGEILESGRVETRRLGKHQGSVYKLAVEPGSPHIVYSCGEDGFVQHFDLRTSSATRLLCCSSLAGNSKLPPKSMRLNIVLIDPRNPNHFAVGGSDEYARVYDIRRCQWDACSTSDEPVTTFCPRHLIETNNVHITGMAYSNTSELLVSYNDELIYLFEKNMGLGPLPRSINAEVSQRSGEPRVYVGHRNSQTVKGVSFFGPGDEYVLSGSDCGHIFIWKKKGGNLVRLMVGDRHIVNQLEPHPHIPAFATCGIEKNVKIWAPMPTEVPPLPYNVNKIMESNRQGREDHSQVALTPDVVMHVLRLQRRQRLAYVERSYNVGTDEEDEDENYVLGLDLSDGYASSGEGSTVDYSECIVS